jgi:hypothetical protein
MHQPFNYVKLIQFEKTDTQYMKLLYAFDVLVLVCTSLPS